MRYCDLRPARDAYARGENVTEHLRRMLGSTGNTSQIIEIAYDLQAGPAMLWSPTVGGSARRFAS
jgi:hypothetical protein